MTIIGQSMRRVLFTTAVVAAAGAASAAELKVQTTGHRSFADVGDSGGQITTTASITIVVTREGLPVSDLGPTVPPNPAGILLPPGVALRNIAGPIGPLGVGCAFTPTAFQNRGNGEYAIKVVPSLSSPVCRWGLGDYHYTATIRKAGDAGIGLGVLTIPATRSESPLTDSAASE